MASDQKPVMKDTAMAEKRDPYDGQPYYCKACGMGWGEYMACEETDCELESEATASMRQKRRRNTGSSLKDAMKEKARHD